MESFLIGLGFVIGLLLAYFAGKAVAFAFEAGKNSLNNGNN